MGVTDPCAFFGVSPGKLLDPIFFMAGIRIIDMEKLEKLVSTKQEESIRDAVMRVYGQSGVDVVLSNLSTDNSLQPKTANGPHRRCECPAP